ncbi:MAG: FkbM family methyltransferase [Microcystis wesenbergii TW10]|uniref:FkbM family methyltransferase n=1 Tax=Microcystis wesenbergii TW10 TaxID=2060474 RepID=A0A3E0M8I0_9CHRO|nr:MAG: FkbM family methyltransferase [Microcystis wesenbergii TW10]
MEATNYKSVGETYKTQARFAQLDMDAFQRLKNLGYQPQVIFDIGASDGSWSKDIHEVLPSAEFHLFEPLIDHAPAYRAIIQENLRLYPNFHLHPLALGEKSGEVTMNIFPNLVASSALDLSDTGLDVTTATVAIATVDEMIASLSLPHPQVIKIDTQGYELSILKGAINTLPRVDILLLECWLYRGYGKNTPLLTEIIGWLQPLGFRLWDIGDTYRGEDDVLATLDCVFVNPRSGISPAWYYTS